MQVTSRHPSASQEVQHYQDYPPYHLPCQEKPQQYLPVNIQEPTESARDKQWLHM